MTSPALSNHNDSSRIAMGKVTYSDPHLNANPNPNPKKKQKQFHEATADAGRYHQPLFHHMDSAGVTQTASDDAYSINLPSTCRNGFSTSRYLTFRASSYSKSELINLRRRLIAELNQVQHFRSRIESGELNIGGSTKSKSSKSKKVAGNIRPVPAVGSVSNKLCSGNGNGVADADDIATLMKECSKIISRLLKLKNSSEFRKPVDVVRLGLHDYHRIVTHPMDLGTVKRKLSGNLYSSPIEFAEDVRLTFNNAILYNPKQDLVHQLAVELLAQFEDYFRPIQEKIDAYVDKRTYDFCEYGDNNELQFHGIDCNQATSSPLKTKKSKPKPKLKSSPNEKSFKEQDHLQAHFSTSTTSNPPAPPTQQQQLVEEFPSSPVRTPPPAVMNQKFGRGTSSKLPKPKAKDQHKRDMTMEEKQKLGNGLQSLPQEKMPQLIQIIKKRNEHLAQDGDEIELDIEAIDTETLWELDRFVTNWKKMVSKAKRQALMMNCNSDAGFIPPPSLEPDHDMGAMMNDDAKNVKENEDVDLDMDDDTPAASSPPVVKERDGRAAAGGADHNPELDNDRATSSSSSSSGSSSSSDSDSVSSSGSESDRDDAQS